MVTEIYRDVSGGLHDVRESENKLVNVSLKMKEIQEPYECGRRGS